MTYDIYDINFINSTYEKNIAKIYGKSEKYVIRHTFVIKNLKGGENRNENRNNRTKETQW